ncbi:MAG: OmpA family protein [Alphaproteobacteria bacterium]|nr:MAG: OmpA family protein [Alphaproteobacteria bacterium]
MEAPMPAIRNPRTSALLRSPTMTRCAYLLLCGLSLAGGAPSASAGELSHNEMVCALDPQCSVPITGRHLRGITATPNVRATPGSFDRTVNFGFNSADLTSEARSELDKVAAVLKDPNIDKYTIVIHGHTDGAGSAQYNQSLSERRAAAARAYFISEHGIDPSRLLSQGHGKSQLLIPSDPANDANRRVQFENANYASASASTSRPATTSPSPTHRPAQGSASTGGDGL